MIDIEFANESSLVILGYLFIKNNLVYFRLILEL